MTFYSVLILCVMNFYSNDQSKHFNCHLSVQSQHLSFNLSNLTYNSENYSVCLHDRPRAN